jgi:flagellar biosynthesis/type III secretory pathway chaperone
MNNLITILQTLAEFHQSLLETAKRKQQILILAEMKPLIAILAEESKLIKKINEADKQRMAILGEQSTLSEIIERQAEGEEKKELLSLQAKLKSLFAEIERVNQTNQQLVEQSLTFTNFMMEQMLPKIDGTGTYSVKVDGKESNESVRFFDAKA